MIRSAKITLLLLLQPLVTCVTAQTAQDIEAAPDSSATAARSSIHSFYAGTGYGSNMLYLGTTMSQDHGFGYASLSYGIADQFYLSATGYSVGGFSPFAAFFNLGINYSHTFNSWFDMSLNLSRYNVAKELRDTLFSNFTYADATLGLDWRILYSRVSAGGLFAGGGQFYLQTRHSRYFETPSFARGKAFFSFDPYFNLLFSTMVTAESAGGVTETTISPGYRPWSKYSQSSSSTPGTIYTESFGLTEIDLGLPISFSYDRFTLEVEPGYVIPMYSVTGSSGTRGFLLMAALFFRIY
jgi:hypothetical protein